MPLAPIGMTHSGKQMNSMCDLFHASILDCITAIYLGSLLNFLLKMLQI